MLFGEIKIHMENRDLWSKVEITASVISALLVPILVLVFGSIITSQQHAAQVAAESRAEYDRVIIDDIVDLHKEISTYLRDYGREIKGETKNSSKMFYDTVAVELSSLSLRFRASAFENISAEQIALLDETMVNIRELENTFDGEISDDILKIVRETINQTFESILGLELKKKHNA